MSEKNIKLCALVHLLVLCALGHNIFPRKREASEARTYGRVTIVPSNTWPGAQHMVLSIKYFWIVSELLSIPLITLWFPNILSFSMSLSFLSKHSLHISVFVKQWFPQTPLNGLHVHFSKLSSSTAFILSAMTRIACEILRDSWNLLLGFEAYLLWPHQRQRNFWLYITQISKRFDYLVNSFGHNEHTPSLWIDWQKRKL